MHFAAFLDVGESVRKPASYYPQQRGRRAERARGDGRRARDAFVFSSTCATYGEPIETPIAETHPQQPINSYGETKLVIERALGPFRARLRAAVDRAALFQRGGRRSGRRNRGGPRAGDPSDSARHSGGGRRARAPGLRRRLPDAGRHLPARLRPRVGPGGRARPGARRAGRDRRSRGPTTSAPAARHSVREVIDGGRARDRAQRAVDARGPAPRRSGGAVRRASQGAGRAGLDAAFPGPRCDCQDRLGLAPTASRRLRDPGHS